MNDFDNKQICSYKDIDRFGFTCDVCGRKVNGCHYINGMSFCEKCYQETFGKDNQQNEIQQLKQQLEEKDKEVTDLEKENGILTNLLATKPTEIELDELYTQLKEKDKEIEQYKSNQKVISLHSKEDWYNRFIDTTRQNIKLEFTQKQLAIQELEKLRDKVVESSEKIVDTVECIQDFHSGITLGRFKRIIDQQIKELKGE